MPEKIRILELINNAVIGGGPIHVILICKYLNRDHFQVWAGCTPRGDLLEEIRAHSDQFISISISKVPNPLTIWKIYKLVKKNKIQVIHTHGGVAGLWGRIAAIFAGKVALVHTLHGIHYLNYKSSFLRRIHIYLERMLSRFTDMTICVADADQKKGLHHKLFPVEKQRILRYGMELEQPSISETAKNEFKKRLNLPQNAILFLNVARLHRQKGQIYLLPAFAEVARACPEAHLLIVGDGPERAAIEAQIQNLGIESQVHLLGARKDVDHLLDLTDIFVLSSLWEGLPLAIIEAMGRAKPIVSTHVDGIAEIIQDQKQGLLVPPGNSAALAEAMMTLIKNSKIAVQLGATARKKVLDEYHIQKMIQQLEQLYSDLAGRNQ